MGRLTEGQAFPLEHLLSTETKFQAQKNQNERYMATHFISTFISWESNLELGVKLHESVQDVNTMYSTYLAETRHEAPCKIPKTGRNPQACVVCTTSPLPLSSLLSFHPSGLLLLFLRLHLVFLSTAGTNRK